VELQSVSRVKSKAALKSTESGFAGFVAYCPKI
jgi:hypothetical protein